MNCGFLLRKNELNVNKVKEKYMEYGLNKENTNEHNIFIRNIEPDLIDSIANFIEMDSKKVAYFINRIGFAWIDEPDIIGVTEVQKERISELKNLVGRSFNG